MQKRRYETNAERQKAYRQRKRNARVATILVSKSVTFRSQDECLGGESFAWQRAQGFECFHFECNCVLCWAERCKHLPK